MVRLEKHGDSAVRFIFTDSDHYLYKDGVVDVPVNSLSLVIDESEMVTFKKASTGDPFISFRLDKSNFSSRDELLTFYKENMVGAGGLSEEEVQEMIDAATSGIPSSEVVEQLRRDVNAVSGEVDTKQDILTAGENITISGNVISADAGNNIIELTQAEYDALETKDPEALYIITDAQEINMNDYYTKSEVDASINTKADASALTAVNNALTAHTANTTVHVTQTEKNTWNGKVDEGYVTDYAYSKNQIDGFLENATTLLQTISGEVDTKVDTTTYESGQYATAQALNALQENKLDASAYTPTDLSEYWTSAQTQSAIDAATSGIPSSQVIEALRNDVNTLSGDVQTNAANIADLVDTIDAKEEVIASALTQLNQDVAEIDAKEEVIASALTEVNLTLDNKLDASAYTPTDLSEYWTSAQTQSAIDAATSGIPSSQVIEALRSDLNTVSGTVENKQDKLQYYGEYTDQWEETDGEIPDSTALFTQKQSDIHIEDSGDEGNSQAGVQTRVDTVKFNGVLDTGHSGSLVNIYANESSNETTEYGSSIEVSDNGVGIKASFIDYDDESSERLASINMNHNDVSISLVSTANGDSTAMAINPSGVTINDERVLTEGDVDNALNSGSTNPVQNAVITQALDNKLDASAYTPTDLSEYWTSAQTQSAINAATSGIPSSQVIEQLRTDINTVSGEVENKQDALVFYSESPYDEEAGTEATAQIYVLGQGFSSGNGAEINVQPYTVALSASHENEDPMSTTLIVQAEGVTINEERVLTEADLSAVTAVSNDLNTLSGAVIDNEYTVSQAINELKSTKLDASAYTPTDLSEYWTSAQTQTAIDGVKAYFIDLDAIMTRGGLTDADWDGAIAAVNAHRPVYIKFYNDHFILESYSLTDNNNTMYLSASDGIAASRFTIIKNGSNDYSLDRAIRGFVTSAEIASWNTKVDASALTTVNNALTAHTADTTVHVTQAEKETWNGKQNGLTAGRGLFINADNTISAPTAVLGQGGTVGVMQIIKLTQAAYDALSTKDAQTLYIVVD